jgi:nitrogenase subunit NifH
VAVANKVKNAEDEEAVRQFCARTELPVIAVIPFDPIISEADKGGSLDIHAIGHSLALQAIKQLADNLLAKVRT